MKLVRLAIIQLTPKPKRPPAACRMSGSDDVDLEISLPKQTPRPEQTQLIAKAITSIAAPPLDSGNHIVVPEEPRLRCETAIMRVADLFAVLTRTRRHVVTATPPLALIPETDDDRALLAQAIAIRANPPRPLSAAMPNLDLAAALPLVCDRWQAVAMLAEAYFQSSLSGRYRELVRFFEMAFRRPFTQCAHKLAQTLAPGMGYTVAEIEQWKLLRHPFSHADGRETNEVAFEADARPVIQRMEQAALDILMNKVGWGVWSSNRRNAWIPAAITTNAEGAAIVRQGSRGVSFEWLMLDEFGVFPRILELTHTNLPTDWFCRFVPESSPVRSVGSSGTTASQV